MASTHRLRIKGVAIAAGGIRLIEGLDLELSTGERVGLVGPSGIGKSTLLRALAGLIDPAAGEVELNGRSPDDLGWPTFRRQVVHVSQRPVLLDRAVRENLTRPFRYRVGRQAFPLEKAERLMVRLGLEQERLEQAARSLSVGQQQRVCLIRALLVEPHFLLLDEPTSALDSETAGEVEAVLSEWSDSGRGAALIVSHDRSQTQRWCHRSIDLTAYRPQEPHA